jgi:hypothetical protein
LIRYGRRENKVPLLLAHQTITDRNNMNKLVKGGVIAVLLMGTLAFAQTGDKQGKRPAGDLMLENASAAAGTPAGRELLEKAHASGLSRTTQNIAAVRQMLASRTTNEERVLALRILGRFIVPSDTSDLNLAILKDVRGQLHSGHRDTARAATFALSRSGSASDIAEVLLRAHKANILDKDEYLGELAHSMRFAPKQKQQEIIALLATESSDYSIDILTMQVADRSLVSSLDPETQKSLQKLFRSHQPNFPIAIGEFGATDGYRYTAWLHAMALLGEVADKKTYSETVLAELGSTNTDPRKVLTFLSSPEGRNLIATVAKKGPFEKALARGKTYAESFPQNAHANALAASISTEVGRFK